MKIPLFKIYSDENDVKAVSEVIKSGMRWAIGPPVAEFEKKICEYIGSKFCVVFNSGTSALHSLMLAYGFHEGDEIIVPSFTFIATANAPLFVNSKPVFADIESKTLGLDPNDVLERITKKSKAILPVHYGGDPANIFELNEIAEDHNLILIEDAAESFGSTVDNKMTGTFGNSALLSFCQNKVITTGEGGAIVTDSEVLYNKLKLIRSHGRVDQGDYFLSSLSGNYVDLGFNFRLSNIQASLGLSQLEKVERLISMRIKIAHYYSQRLNAFKEIITPQIRPNIRHVYQLFSIRIPYYYRDRLIEYLSQNQISSKIYFSPIHQTYFYKEKLKYDVHLPVTETISKEILSLPIYPSMTRDEQEYVVRSIDNFIKNFESDDKV